MVYQILRLPAVSQCVAHRGEKLAAHTISQFQSMGIADIQSPVTAPVNINHHLLSPGMLAADAKRGAAIAVTVNGQRLIYGKTPVDMGDRSNLLWYLRELEISAS